MAKEDEEDLENRKDLPEEEEKTKQKVSVNLRDVHNLRMQGKTAAQIAAGYGVKRATVYGWFQEIKKKHPAWVDEWMKK